MSRRKYEQAVAQLAKQIASMESNVETLIEMGAAREVAAMVGPKPEAIVYVNTMRTLFKKFDEGIVVTAEDMLKEIEDAWLSFYLWRDNVHVTYVSALTEVGKDLFVISENDIIEARHKAQIRNAVQKHKERQEELVRHGWNGVLGD